MNLKEFANVDSFYRDLDTGREIKWEDYMHRVIGKLGLENIRPYLPYNIEHLQERFKSDENFNNTKLEHWETCAGMVRNINRNTKVLEYIPTKDGLSAVFLRNGITCFSVSDGVCVLKEAAKILVKEECNEQKGNH